MSLHYNFNLKISITIFVVPEEENISKATEKYFIFKLQSLTAPGRLCFPPPCSKTAPEVEEDLRFYFSKYKKWPHRLCPL